MKNYLIVTNYDGITEFSTWWAEDEEHAKEQLADSVDEYNPVQYITHIFVSESEIVNNEVYAMHAKDSEFYANLKVGDEVHWEDPDNGISSGIYRITEIFTESGVITHDNDMLMLHNGMSEVECFAHELR